MKPVVYLAGPITGKSYEQATGWRRSITRRLIPGIGAASPLRGKDYLSEETDLAHTYPKPLSTEPAIVGRDFFDVREVKIVCLNLLGTKVVSIGSMIEIGWAVAARTPLLLIMEAEGNPHDHPFVRRAATWRVDNAEEAVFIINSTLEPYVQ